MSTDWMSLWENWSKHYAGGFSAIDAGAGSDPFASAFAGYRQFVDAISDILPTGRNRTKRADFTDLAEQIRKHTAAFYSSAQQTPWAAASATWGDASCRAGAPGMGGAAAETLHKWAMELLELPIVGPQREWLVAQQDLAKALADQQHALTTLGEHYRSAAAVAVQRFISFLGQENDTPVDSIRALYDVWIDLAEAAYREQAMTAQFSRDFGAWVNATARARAKFNVVRERVTDLFDLPKRAEIDALVEQNAALKRNVDGLRDEVRGLRKSQTQTPRPAAAVSAPQAPVAEAQKLRSPRRKKPPASARKQSKTKPAQLRVKTPKREFDIGQILGD